MCGCECCMSSKSIHYLLLTWLGCNLKHLKDRSHNAQNRGSGEIYSRIFKTYNNAVQPHGCHIYNNSAYISMEKICTYTSKHHGIPH